MLGLEARAAVPQPSPQVARLEVLPPANCETPESLHLVTDANLFSYHLKWPGQLPAKCNLLFDNHLNAGVSVGYIM